MKAEFDPQIMTLKLLIRFVLNMMLYKDISSMLLNEYIMYMSHMYIQQIKSRFTAI